MQQRIKELKKIIRIINFQKEKIKTLFPIKSSLSPKAFTLIELLVVIAVIGLLSSIVMVSLKSAREKAKDARMSEVLYQIELAANLDYQNYGNWSPDVGPNNCSCHPGTNRPRFVSDGIFPSDAWDNLKWYNDSQVCFDWQNWDNGNWISIDLYKCRSDGTCCDVIRRRCIYDAPGGGVCTNF